MKYILTGGGSGGHIYPLLSFAHVVRELDADADFLFVGKQNNIEGEIVPQAGIPFKGIATTGTRGRISWQNMKAGTLMGIGYLQAQNIIQQFQPDVCLGGGGYVSVPLMLAANKKKAHIVTAVLESDQFMGKANLQLAKKSDLIFGGLFDLKAQYFADNDNYYHVGHPRMQELYESHQSAIENKERSHSMTNVLFVGGSLGAEMLNEQAVLFAQYVTAQKARTQITLITGKRYYEAFKSYEAQYPCLHVVAYAEQIADYYLAADLLVTRASAGVLAEATTFNLPFIAIPSPNVMRNHQFYNARYFVERGAGLVYEEAAMQGMDFPHFIAQTLQDEQGIQQMKHNLRQLMHKDVVTKMYHLLAEAKAAKKNP